MNQNSWDQQACELPSKSECALLGFVAELLPTYRNEETHLEAVFWLEWAVLLHAGAERIQFLCLQGTVIPLYFSSDCGAIR